MPVKKLVKLTDNLKRRKKKWKKKKKLEGGGFLGGETCRGSAVSDKNFPKKRTIGQRRLSCREKKKLKGREGGGFKGESEEKSGVIRKPTTAQEKKETGDRWRNNLKGRRTPLARKGKPGKHDFFVNGKEDREYLWRGPWGGKKGG